MNTEKVTIKRIGPNSALKAGAAVGLVFGAVIGILNVAFTVAPYFYLGVGLEQILLLSGLPAILGAIGGGVSALVAAWVYNIALNLTGGLQLEISFENDGAAASKGKHGPHSLDDLMQDDA